MTDRGPSAQKQRNGCCSEKIKSKSGGLYLASSCCNSGTVAADDANNTTAMAVHATTAATLTEHRLTEETIPYTIVTLEKIKRTLDHHIISPTGFLQKQQDMTLNRHRLDVIARQTLPHLFLLKRQIFSAGDIRSVISRIQFQAAD